MNITGFIPARYASSRFPGKPLVEIRGKSMIRRVYEQAVQAEKLNAVYVLTDDERIFAHVLDFGGKALMTSAGHRSGTDRILEAIGHLPCDACINIQGDEPYISPRQIDQVAETFFHLKGAFVSTLIRRMTDLRELNMSSVIKVVTQRNGEALYFSRSPIPYLREPEKNETWIREQGYYKHIGIYGYSAEALQLIPAMQPGILEMAESLEQLRWMENGLPVFTSITSEETISIDTPEDIARLEEWLQSQ
jgi:3-deoxy-manno-octulosonate cytidylyltransferase (CMP-KDO synthetase)